MNESILKISTHFFEKLGVDYSDLVVIKEDVYIYRVALKSEDSHLLIGPHGKNLDTISHLLKLIVSRKYDTSIQIHLEVNDYLEKKDEKLMSFIASKIEQVKSTGKEVILPAFSSYDRKKVHSFVSENGGNVFTQSQGEGKERRIHLCKKDEKMTIDIDGDDI